MSPLPDTWLTMSSESRARWLWAELTRINKSAWIAKVTAILEHMDKASKPTPDSQDTSK